MTPIRWRVVLPQMFLILLPTLVLGSGLGGAIVDATDPTLDDLGPLWLLNVLPGVLGGLVLGWLLTPTRRQLWRCLAAVAALEVALLLILIAIASSRVAGPAPELSAYVRSLVSTVGTLVVVAGVLWWWKGSRLRDSATDQA